MSQVRSKEVGKRKKKREEKRLRAIFEQVVGATKRCAKKELPSFDARPALPVFGHSQLTHLDLSPSHRLFGDRIHTYQASYGCLAGRFKSSGATPILFFLAEWRLFERVQRVASAIVSEEA
jgi:hypothetical protein